MKDGITVSLVSHGHDLFVNKLIPELESINSIKKIILINNIPPKHVLIPTTQQKTIIINNESPQGFGQNHNFAFTLCDTRLFCIMNPDICLKGDPFPRLTIKMKENNISMIAPIVRNPNGDIEDSFRKFPGLFSLIKRKLGLSAIYSPPTDKKLFYPEWLAGMFMLFDSACYRKITGFDENFFLYCEDVDICIRTKACCGKIALDPSVSVIHDARRASRKNLQFALWHIKSLLYLWRKYPRYFFGK